MTFKRHLGGYAGVGVVQWLLEYGLMVVLSATVMPVGPANIIGRIFGASFGFWLNGRYTFKGDGRSIDAAAFLRFWSMWAVLTVLNTAVVHGIDAQWGLKTAWALKPGVDALSGSLGFLLSRHWVYGGGARNEKRETRNEWGQE